MNTSERQNQVDIQLWERFLAIALALLVLILPALVVAPRYFAGEIEFGVITPLL